MREQRWAPLQDVFFPHCGKVWNRVEIVEEKCGIIIGAFWSVQVQCGIGESVVTTKCLSFEFLRMSSAIFACEPMLTYLQLIVVTPFFAPFGRNVYPRPHCQTYVNFEIFCNKGLNIVHLKCVRVCGFFLVLHVHSKLIICDRKKVNGNVSPQNGGQCILIPFLLNKTILRH